MPRDNTKRPNSTEATDWNAVRGAALDSLNATWSLVCWANRSLGYDYDEESAALHLAAIDSALNTFRRAREIVQPGLDCATVDSLRHSPAFDALALASVGEGPRPDFGYATAHEKAFELLRAAILWVENGLNDELDRRGAPDNCLEGIDDLRKRSPKQLRVSLQHLEKNQSLRSVLSGRQLNELRAWINREWAAAAAKHGDNGPPCPLEPFTSAEELYEEIVENSDSGWKQTTQFANKAWRAREMTHTAFASEKGFYKEQAGWVLFKKQGDRWHTLIPEPSHAEKIEKFFQQQKP